VLGHITPEVLSQHLPRPLWARLLTACLGAPKVDAQLVIETIGVPNLCEHVPTAIVWGCLADIAGSALVGSARDGVPAPVPAAVPKQSSQPAQIPLAAAPPETAPRRPTPQPQPAVPGPAIPGIADGTDSGAAPRASVPGNRFRPPSQSLGRIGQSQ